MPRRTFIFAALLILLVAASLRLIALHAIPPGLHFDEATNGVILRSMIFEGYRPIFITSYTGKEPLWFYLAALLSRFVGLRVFSMRLTSAFVGLLTVAATGWFVRQLYTHDSRRDWLALLSMAILAIAFWHGLLNRLAFRANTEPLLQAISLGLLWKALHARPGRPRLSWMAIAGVFTGLAAYTYLAVRLYPITLAIALLFLLIHDRDRFARLPGLLAYGLSAAAVFAPLGWFFLCHPETFSTRIEQLAPATFEEALAGIRMAIGMLFAGGDPLWRFNIPGKPLFGPILAACLLVGLVMAVRDAFRPDSAPDRSRAALLIVWLPVMLAPTALASEGFAPSNLRAVSLLPVLVLYPAFGIVAVVAWVRKRIQTTDFADYADLMLPGSLILTLFVGGALTLRDTLKWGQLLVLYYDNDGHVQAVGEYLNTGAPDATPYVATFHFQHPTLAFFAKEYGKVRSLFGGEGLVLAPSGETLAIYTRDALPPEGIAMLLYPYQVAAPPGPDGSPDFYAYLLPEDFSTGWQIVTPANFANLIRLERAWLPAAKGGSDGTVYLEWRILNSADLPDYAFVAEVCDAWGWCWVKANVDGTLERGVNDTYPSLQWTSGERLITPISIPLPEGMPPGAYKVRVSLYSQSGDKRLPMLDDRGAFGGLVAEIPDLTIQADRSPDVLHLPVQYRLDAPVAPAISLLGYDLPVVAVRSGQQIDLALYWLATSRPNTDAKVRLLLDDGTVLHEGNPVHGTYPTSAWSSGELVPDRYRVRIPYDLPSGDYTLTVQMGEADPIPLGTLTVEAVKRNFDLPEHITLLEPVPVFNGQITLAGFDAPVSQVAPGGGLTLTLAWRAEAEILTGYTVFVHLIAPDGTIAAQQDRPPMAGGAIYPTDLWLPGEVVIDSYQFQLPPGTEAGIYQIRIGLYLPDNGLRLTLADGIDHFILPIEIAVR